MILQKNNILNLPEGIEIQGIAEDILYVKEDYIFVVRKGKNYDSFKDIDEALNKKAIVVHEDEKEKRGYYVSALEEKLNVFLQEYYQNISDQFCVVGVCGSNGKSSVVTMLYEMMKPESCMCIKTHSIESAYFQFINHNTTPGIITLMHLFQLAKQHGIKYIFMEVSSHAIEQNRIQFLRFDAIIYTNIARDHMDYHKTLLQYRYTKYKLMQYLKEDGVVIANKDELYYTELKKLCKKTLYTYGNKNAHFEISDVQMSLNRTTFCVNRFYFHTHLLSMMNIYNLSACIALFRIWNFTYFTLYKKILHLSKIKGRMEVVYSKRFHVVIDYAHTSKAFLESVKFLHALKNNRLIIVVGCGGEREKEKREEIGYYASKYGDVCIFTEDNSRNEEVLEIVQSMCKRVDKEVCIIVRREKAIEYAIKNAQNGDIILVSGKGDESYLYRNGMKIVFNDKEKILELVE